MSKIRGYVYVLSVVGAGAEYLAKRAGQKDHLRRRANDIAAGEKGRKRALFIKDTRFFRGPDRTVQSRTARQPHHTPLQLQLVLGGGRGQHQVVWASKPPAGVLVRLRLRRGTTLTSPLCIVSAGDLVRRLPAEPPAHDGLAR